MKRCKALAPDDGIRCGLGEGHEGNHTKLSPTNVHHEPDGDDRGWIGVRPTKSRKQRILDTVTDLVTNFMFYDRKEDEDLQPGAIEAAIEAGEISVDEIVERFASLLRTGIDGD